jgi:hypothetical protein
VKARRVALGCGAVAAASAFVAAVLTAAGVWCPYSYVRFGGGWWRLDGDKALAGATCFAVSSGEALREAPETSWPVTHRITSGARVSDIRAFVSAHSGGWQENIFASDTPRQAFRACDAAAGGQWFVLGDETLGITQSKNYSRPLCRRDRKELQRLLQPESRG